MSARPSRETLARQLEQHGVKESLELMFECPHAGCEVHGLRVPGRRSVQAWAHLREPARSCGFTPVLIDAPLEPAPARPGRKLAGGLAWPAVDTFDAVEKKAQRTYQRRSASPLSPKASDGGALDLDAIASGLVTPWTFSAQGEPVLRPELWLAFLPVEQPWKAPAVVQFGAFNACPPPQKHTALLRSWEEEFGAVPVAMTRDRIELGVRRPPATLEIARALAKEHRRYCADTVVGGHGFERWIEGLCTARLWSFWWD